MQDWKDPGMKDSGMQEGKDVGAARVMRETGIRAEGTGRQNSGYRNYRDTGCRSERWREEECPVEESRCRDAGT